MTTTNVETRKKKNYKVTSDTFNNTTEQYTFLHSPTSPTLGPSLYYLLISIFQFLHYS